MLELKYARIQEHVQRLQADVARPRAAVSEASASLIRYCRQTRDPLLPSVWTEGRHDDPYAPQTQKGCECI
ncbi:hypothetical protein M408DRAFT_329150, partial [Serendipita vermifera MAFF 305830]